MHCTTYTVMYGFLLSTSKAIILNTIALVTATDLSERTLLLDRERMADSRLHLWRTLHEVMDPVCQQNVMKAGRRSIMVWRNCLIYTYLFTEHLHSFMLGLFLGIVGLFPKNNVITHRVRIT